MSSKVVSLASFGVLLLTVLVGGVMLFLVEKTYDLSQRVSRLEGVQGSSQVGENPKERR